MDNKQTPHPIESISTGDNGFPSKPSEETKKQSLQRSLLSLGLFIAAFYLIFKWDISFILVLAGVLFIHEMGHFLAMRYYKYNDLGIFFVPLVGALATGKKDNISQKQNIIVLLAGPLPGVLIGIILYYFALRDESNFLLRTSNIFIILNLFNLLPVMPLDGGRIIKSLFFENNELINKVFLILSIAALTIYSIYSKSYTLLIIPVFLVSQISAQTQVEKVRGAIRRKGIDMNKSFEELSDEEYWLIRDEIGTHVQSFSQYITPKDYTLASNEQRIIKQIKTIIQKKPEKDLKVGGKVLISAIWIMTFVIPFIAIALYHIRLGIVVQ